MIHHKIISALIKEVRSLREQLEDYSNSMYRIESRNQQLRDENDRQERERERERQEEQSRQWQREDLINKLDRAERLGDQWTATRTKKELKNL